jgi:hypothetical protein
MRGTLRRTKQLAMGTIRVLECDLSGRGLEQAAMRAQRRSPRPNNRAANSLSLGKPRAS